jgi:hypothetical protein
MSVWENQIKCLTQTWKDTDSHDAGLTCYKQILELLCMKYHEGVEKHGRAFKAGFDENHMNKIRDAIEFVCKEVTHGDYFDAQDLSTCFWTAIGRKQNTIFRGAADKRRDELKKDKTTIVLHQMSAMDLKTEEEEEEENESEDLEEEEQQEADQKDLLQEEEEDNEGDEEEEEEDNVQMANIGDLI